MVFSFKCKFHQFQLDFFPTEWYFLFCALPAHRPYFSLPVAKVGKSTSVSCSHTLRIQIIFCIRKNLPPSGSSPALLGCSRAPGSILFIRFSISVLLRILNEQATHKKMFNSKKAPAAPCPKPPISRTHDSLLERNGAPVITGVWARWTTTPSKKKLRWLVCR